MTSLKKRVLIASTAAALLAGASLSVFAMGGGDRCDGPGAGQSGPRAEKMHKMMGERMAKRQADLKEKLKLTPAQESSWTAFTAATQPPQMHGMQRPDPAEMAKLTTPQRMEKMQAMKTERDAQMTKRLEAVKAFYATLNPEQQKVFDAETLNHHHEGHMGNKRGQHGPQNHPGMKG